MFKDTPKGLLDAVKGIVTADARKFAEEQAAAQAKYVEKKMKQMPQGKAEPAAVKGAEKVVEAKAHTIPKTEKEKALAALAEPKDKITHADVMKGRGVSEGWDDMIKAAKARKDELESKKKTKTGHDVKQTSTGTVYTKTYDKKTGLSEEENQDTPGNSTHQCAIHVKSEQFGEGRTLTGQHAEPSEDGTIAWYDVMFDEGIHRVETKDIEVLVSESHMNHKKKKM